MTTFLAEAPRPYHGADPVQVLVRSISDFDRSDL
jgi:hypothetical protein